MSKSDDLKNRLDEIFSTMPAPAVLEPEEQLPVQQLPPIPEPEPVTLETAAFEVAFEFAAVGIVMTTKDGRFLRLNNAFCRMLGYDQKELQGKSFQSITYKEDLQVGSDATD